MIIEETDPFGDQRTLHPIAVAPTESLPDYDHPNSSGIRPPRYSLPRPPQPQIYTFTSWSHDTTFLLPPSAARIRSSLYRISVALNLNPFSPLSYITTVRRGDDIDGDIVGEFEIGVHYPGATVTMGIHSLRMDSILTNFDRSPPPRTIWRWKHHKIDLRWDCRSSLDDGSPMCICMDARKHQLASFIPPPLNASPPPPSATLTVFPDGHEALDDIVLSALVIARKITLSL